jgi:four helix bundle protein
MKQNIIQNKSFAFAVSIVNEIKLVQEQQNECLLSKQILTRGTAVGAIVREAEYAGSRQDFLQKMTLALNEASQTEYWLDLLHDAGYLPASKHIALKPGIEEIIKLLIAITKTAKQNIIQQNTIKAQ